ncbi:hypothetical protein JOF29_003936 [Kribbella aluminosa]|uniref:Uncharacterized protein n=1 Tax=Kribbella aluminosa TaxID=416017 RepID=A0ABS4UMH5_9ACTN|nr:hypothetical protein [Kribbella aluminosa]
MCTLPPEVRAALYGAHREADAPPDPAETPMPEEEPVGHHLVHD